MTPIIELLRLLDERRQFSLTITSEDDAWRVTIADAVREMSGSGQTFEDAWLDLAIVSAGPTIGEILHQAQIWVDLHEAAEAVEAEAARSS